MFLTVTLVLLITTVMVFFAQEIMRTLKRIFANKYTALLIPLAIGSWAVYALDYWIYWAFTLYHETLVQLMDGLMWLLPFQTGAWSVAAIIVLSVVSIVPVIIAEWLSVRKSYKHYPYPFITSTLIWLITAEILIAY